MLYDFQNAKQLPVLNPAEKLAQQSTLRLQFPVSSGTQHRDKEGEWVPVEKDKEKALVKMAPPPIPTSQATTTPGAQLALPAPPPPPPTILAEVKAADKVFPDLPSEVSFKGLIRHEDVSH